MTKYEILTLVISSFALLFSLPSLYFSYKQHKWEEEKHEEKQDGLNKTTVKIKKGFGTNFWIENRGRSCAYNINLTFSLTPGKSSPFADNEIEDTFPIKKLEPHESKKLHFLSDGETDNKINFVASWINEDGSNSEKEYLISKTD